jgi:urease accessory protein
MVVIESLSTAAREAVAGKARDTLRLTWEGRRWTRRRVKTTGGREVALALPTGTVLAVGARLWVDADWYLEVEGAPEPVIAVLPKSHAEGLRVAFEVGNRHFSVALDGDVLLVPDDTAMTQLLDRLGARWERREAVYTPMGFGHPHGNGHDHGHAHSQGHAHSHPHEHSHEH